MPAEPYSLGIGIEVDQHAIELTTNMIESRLGGVFKRIRTESLKDSKIIADAYAGAFKSMGAGAAAGPAAAPAPSPVEQLAGMLPGGGPDEIAGMLPGAIGEAAPAVEDMKKGLKGIEPLLESIGTLTDTLNHHLLKLGSNSDAMGASLKQLAEGGVPKTTKALQGLDAEAKEKPKDLDKVRFSAGALFNALGYGAKVVSDFAMKMRQGFDFTKNAEDLEKASIRMAVGMGGAWKEADKLRDNIIDLGLATSQNLAEMTKMAVGLSDTGTSLSEFSGATQAAIINLGHNFGLTGEQVATTSKTLNTFGSNLGDTLGEATAFQKGFKIPGVFEQLPGIVNFARDTFLSFSSAVVGSGADLVKSAMHTAGTFAKAFGTTMGDAVKRAEQAMGKFAGAAQQDQDVFLGLSTEFSGLTTTLMQAGVPIKDAMNLVQSGVDDAVGSAEKYRKVLDRMPNKFMKDRFMRQLQKELPQDIFALVKDKKLLDKTLADKKAASAIEQTFGGQGVNAFNDMAGTIQSATSEVRDLFNNMVELGKAVFGQIGKMLGFDKILSGATDTLRDWNKGLLDFVHSEGFKAFIEKIKPAVVGIGKVLLSVGTIVGGVAGSIGGLWTAWRTASKGLMLAQKGFGPLAKLVPSLGKGLGKLTGILGFFGKGALKVLGKLSPIGRAYAIFEGVKEAVMDMGAVLGDPNATGMEQFEAITRGLLKGVGKAFDSLLLGIPSTILKSFFPDMEESFDKGLSGLFDKVSDMFSGEDGGFLSAIGGAFSKTGDFLSSHLPDLNQFASKFGKALGGVFGFVVKTSAKGMKAIFIDLPIAVLTGGAGLIASAFKSMFGDATKAGADTVKENFTFDKVLKFIYDWTQPIRNFFYELGDGIAGAFGTSLKAVGLRFQIVWEVIKTGAQTAGDFIYDTFANFFAGYLPMAINDMIGYVEKAFTVNIPSKLAKGLVYMTSGWSVAWAGMKLVTFELVTGVTKGIGEMVTSVIDKLKGMANALPDFTPGIKEIRNKLDATKASVGGLSSGFEEMRKEAEKGYKGSKDAMDKDITAIEQRQKVLNKSIDDTTISLNEHFNKQIDAREAVSKQNQEEHKKRVGQLSYQLELENDLTRRRQEAATDTRRFQKEAKKGLDATLASFASEEEKAGVGGEGIKTGSKALKDYMDQSIASIAADVEKGSINIEQAAERLKQAGAEGMTAARKAAAGAYKPEGATPAGAVAERAGAAPAVAQGMNADAMKQMLSNFQQAVQGAKVDVTLRGGDDVTRAMARKSQVDAFNAGN